VRKFANLGVTIPFQETGIAGITRDETAALTMKRNRASSHVRLEPPATPQLRHWWVNHERSDRAEVDGSYLWFPKKNKNGSRSRSHLNMTCLMPGDVVFYCAAGTITAIGVVLERARGASVPAQPNGQVQSGQTDDGWLAAIRFVELAQPLRPKDHLAAIKPLLPKRQSPLRVSGESNPIYLAEIPAAMTQVLRALLNGQVEDCEARIGMEMDGKLAEKAIEEHIWQRFDIGPQDRRQLIGARVGQGIFRERVEQMETACRVTGILDRRYLRATHIKPWKEADDREKLDGSNGLLLSPHIQHLFDRGQISFADDGTLLISRHLNPYVRKAWGLETPVSPRAFAPEQRAYLHYHRLELFEKIGGGRRAAVETTLETDIAEPARLDASPSQ
jgi:putative restriction endonuclease